MFFAQGARRTSAIEQSLGIPSCLALGECGLDRSRRQEGLLQCGIGQEFWLHQELRHSWNDFYTKIMSSISPRTVEMSKVLVRRFSIGTRKLIREMFSANSVDISGKVAPSDRSTSSFDSPHRLRKCADSRGGVKNDLRAVKSVAHPVEGMVSTVADIDRDFAEIGFKNLCRY